MPNTVVLSQYPLTSEVQDDLRPHVVGDLQFLIVSNIVHSGYRSLLSQLRGVNCTRLILYFPGTNNDFMLPIFRVMAGLMRADERFVLRPRGSVVKWTRSVLLKDLLLLGLSFLNGAMALLFSTAYFAVLIGRGRARVPISQNLAAKKILYIRPTLWHGLSTGGAISHGRGVIDALVEQNYQVDIVAEALFVKNSSERVRTHIVNPSLPYAVPRELNFFNLQKNLVKYLKDKIGSTFDGVIYQRLAVGSVAGVILSRFWRVPLIVEFNGSEVWLANNWGNPFYLGRFVSYIEKAILGHAHMIVTVSEALKRELISKGVESSRVAVCPNGVAVDRFHAGKWSEVERRELRQRFGFEDGDVVYIFVGTFGHWHGVGLLADVINEIFKAGVASPDIDSARVKFLLVGHGVEFNAVEKQLSGKISDGRVVMTGLVDENCVPDLLEISDVSLTPILSNPDGSEFFGSPTKQFEYMAAGKPVIASALGQIVGIMSGSPHIADLVNSNADIAIDANSNNAVGLLFEAGDATQLKAAILALAADAGARRRMSENAARIAREKHTWQVHVERFLTHLAMAGEREAKATTRLLINALHSKSGGGITYLHNILPVLARMPGLDVHVMLHTSQRELFKGVFENVTPHYTAVGAGLAGIMFVEQFNLPGISRRIGADVVFSTANYGPLAIRNGVVLIRNSLEVAAVERRLRKLLYWGGVYCATVASIFSARGIIAVSSYAWDSCLRGSIIDMKNKVTIIPHGVSGVFAKNKRRETAPPFILAVSDIYIQKNIHTLLEGFAHLCAEHPELKLKIAGKPIDANYFARLQGIVAKLDIGHSVEFLGHVDMDDLCDLYGTCTMFVFPSTVETFGNPLVESMASGCPVICSEAAAMPEVAGDAVVYVDPSDAFAFYRAMETFIADPELRAEYSRRARERGQFYSWDATARKTVDVLLSIRK